MQSICMLRATLMVYKRNIINSLGLPNAGSNVDMRTVLNISFFVKCQHYQRVTKE